ncbi:DUF2505 domain-containing protein [Acaricomes phytoseiuli]|uniref:DUF2505 domain-containing protein n=1 Tax=Acaricomes phytoseiuli TaxID=291968 RepID=UPI0004776C02|nr:DUF2505 domain-containing protein [Acaricomes phytoseiuli]MCW1249263.1 DUF2505 domain-containing protein [Acaricomes phytoseiuli]
MPLNSAESLPAPVARVTELLRSEEFIRRVSEATGGSLDSFTLTGDPEGAFELGITRSFPTSELSELVQKFAGARLSIQQNETWAAPGADESREVSIHASVSGAPVEIVATQRLLPDTASAASADSATQSATRVEVAGTVSCSIPFLGERIAAAAEPALTEALRLQISEARKTLEDIA